MTSRFWSALVVVSLSVTITVAQPCHNHVVPGYGLGSLIGSVNSGAVFDDHSGTGPALFIAGNSGASLRIGNQGISLAKLVDGHWVPNTAIGGNVTCMTVLDDGSGPALYLGGFFTISPSTSYVNVAKWDGNTWVAYPTLNTLSGDPYTPPVSTMVIHNDGSGPALYVGGNFNGVSQSSHGLVRWNGQAWEAVGTGLFGDLFSVVVRALASFDDGTGNKLYVGGDFSMAGGVTVTGLASWDGSQWGAVGPGFASGTYRPVVHSLAVHDDGTGPGLYIAGVINMPDRNYGNCPVALWKNGALTRVLFGLDADPSMEAGGAAVISLDDGTGPALYVAVGHLVEGASRVMRLQNGSWETLGGSFFSLNATGFGATVNALVSLPTPGGSRLVSLGNTTSNGAANAPPAAEWNRGTWSSLESGALGLAGPATVISDGQRIGAPLFASGFMLTDEGWSGELGTEPYPSAGYVHIDINGAPSTLTGNASGMFINQGAGWESFPNPGPLTRLAVADDGTGPGLFALMYGQWQPPSGDSTGRVAKWNGSSWDTILQSAGAGERINALASYDDGTGSHVYIGGTFTMIDGSANQYLAEWINGQWTPISGVGGLINDLLVFDVGSGPELILAGNVNADPENTNGGIARWNGSRLASIGFDPGGEGFVLRAFDDGRGSRLWFGGTGSVRNLTYWNGTTWTAATSSPGPSTVYSLAEVDRTDGSRSLFFGGNFAIIGNVQSSYIGELAVCHHTCTADFNGDGDVGTDQDIDAFFACLSGNCCASCASADFNNDGDVGTDADIESFFRVLGGGSC